MKRKLRKLRKHRQKKRYKHKYKLIFIITFTILFFIFMNIKIVATIYKKSNFEISRFATNEINTAITQAINDYGYDYDDYVTVKTTKEGNIIAIYTNSKKITLIHNDIIDKINKRLEEIKNHKIKISLGTLTGIVWLSSRGPNIPVKIAYNASANSEIVSSLKECGINQTLHKIHINVYMDIIAFFPFHSEKVKAESSCMLAESLIIGQVPQHYTKVISRDATDISDKDTKDISNNTYSYNE